MGFVSGDVLLSTMIITILRSNSESFRSKITTKNKKNVLTLPRYIALFDCFLYANMMHPPFGNLCLAFGIASLLGKPLGLELDSTATVRSKGGEFSPWERGWEVAKVHGKSQTGFLEF